MINFLTHAWWLILVLGILVTFHEYGHFWVARRMGVKVLRFSVGFGKPLLLRRGPDGTEYVLAAIPLGGYVKMLDEREAPVARNELDQAFNRKSLAARTAIVAAGPIFNLILAVFAFWVMFLVGVEEPKTILSNPTSLAAAAGFEQGEQIVAINDRSVENWTHVMLAMIGPALDGGSVSIAVTNDIGETQRRSLNFADLNEPIDEQRLLSQVGLNPWQPIFTYRNELGEVSPELPAAQAGLQSGDRIIQVGQQAVSNWTDIVRALNVQAEPGQPLRLTYQRGAETRSLTLTPISITDANGRQQTRIGIAPVELSEQEYAVQVEQLRAEQQRNTFIWRHGPVTAVAASVREMWQFTTATMGMLGRMVTGKASLDNLSGPITIASLAKRSAELGLSTFLRLLALISLSLAILNLLPIPMLDGGHLLYYLIEWLTGKPVSERIQLAGQGIGMLMLVCLMGLAFYNDIARLVS